jgi:hypothetical protein
VNGRLRRDAVMADMAEQFADVRPVPLLDVRVRNPTGADGEAATAATPGSTS